MYQTTRPLQTTGSSPGPARMSSYSPLWLSAVSMTVERPRV